MKNGKGKKIYISSNTDLDTSIMVLMPDGKTWEYVGNIENPNKYLYSENGEDAGTVVDFNQISFETFKNLRVTAAYASRARGAVAPRAMTIREKTTEL